MDGGGALNSRDVEAAGGRVDSYIHYFSFTSPPVSTRASVKV